MDDEQPQNGRGASFKAGAMALSSPKSSMPSVQQIDRGFTPTSTLEQNQIVTPANGMSVADRARQPVGGASPSLNGQSDSTFQSRQWLGNKSRTYGN